MAWPVYGVVCSRRREVGDDVVVLEVPCCNRLSLDATDDGFDEGSMMIAKVLTDVTVTAVTLGWARLAADEVD